MSQVISWQLARGSRHGSGLDWLAGWAGLDGWLAGWLTGWEVFGILYLVVGCWSFLLLVGDYWCSVFGSLYFVVGGLSLLVDAWCLLLVVVVIEIGAL